MRVIRLNKGKDRKMKTRDFIEKYQACENGAKWALSLSGDMADVWDAMIEQGKHNWLRWTVTRPNVFTDSVLRKLACRFIREAPLSDGKKVWDLLADERSKNAVEVAEQYAEGKATDAELKSACAAASAAADDAASAAARAAARAAVYVAARDLACNAAASAALAAARVAAFAAADAADAADAVYAAARAATNAAQVRMIAELGNPFRDERAGR